MSATMIPGMMAGQTASERAKQLAEAKRAERAQRKAGIGKTSSATVVSHDYASMTMPNTQSFGSISYPNLEYGSVSMLNTDGSSTISTPNPQLFSSTGFSDPVYLVAGQNTWWLVNPTDEDKLLGTHTLEYLEGHNRIPEVEVYAKHCTQAEDGTRVMDAVCDILKLPRGTLWGEYPFEKRPVTPPLVMEEREEEC